MQKLTNGHRPECFQYVSHYKTGFVTKWVLIPSLLFCVIVYCRLLLPVNLTSPPLARIQTCYPVRTNVGYLKVHKAGSTTVMNILQRYAYYNDLFIALPQKGIEINEDFSNLIPVPKYRKYNMVINHVAYYNRTSFARVLPSDTVYVAIVREPLDQTISAFEYFLNVWQIGLYQRIPGKDKLKEYLKHREQYDPPDPAHSATNNRMAFDFGLPKTDFRNVSAIMTYLTKLDSEMDLVMVLEYFPESLVFLRRLLCWDIKNMLFLKRNVYSNKTRLTFTEDELKYHRNYSLADNMFYDYFLKKFKHKLEAEKSGFWAEVAVLKYMIKTLKDYCEELERNPTLRTTNLDFNRTDFSEPFSVGFDDCRVMSLIERDFVNISRQKQLKSGENERPYLH